MHAPVHPLMGWMSTAPAIGVKQGHVEKSMRVPPGPGNARGEGRGSCPTGSLLRARGGRGSRPVGCRVTGPAGEQGGPLGEGALRRSLHPRGGKRGPIRPAEEAATGTAAPQHLFPRPETSAAEGPAGHG